MRKLMFFMTLLAQAGVVNATTNGQTKLQVTCANNSNSSYTKFELYSDTVENGLAVMKINENGKEVTGNADVRMLTWVSSIAKFNYNGRNASLIYSTLYSLSMANVVFETGETVPVACQLGSF